MTKSTRYFLIGSAVVVLLGLGTGLVAYYNGGLPGVRRRRRTRIWPICPQMPRPWAMPTFGRS